MRGDRQEKTDASVCCQPHPCCGVKRMVTTGIWGWAALEGTLCLPLLCVCVFVCVQSAPFLMLRRVGEVTVREGREDLLTFPVTKEMTHRKDPLPHIPSIRPQEQTYSYKVARK